MNFNVDQMIVLLARTPKVMRTLLHNLPADWTGRDYGPDTWSVHEILGHLIWGERTDWVPRVRHVLTLGESPAFEPFDRNGHSSLCREKNTSELLDLFESERSNNLEELSALSLSEDDLKKTGQHPAFGQVSVAELLATWTAHDLNHIAQVSKAMAYQLKNFVGPWEAYLSILSPPNPR